MLDGIEIISKMPITIKGDTIIYNASDSLNLEGVIVQLGGQTSIII
jgi:hypothetical protein